MCSCVPYYNRPIIISSGVKKPLCPPGPLPSKLYLPLFGDYKYTPHAPLITHVQSPPLPSPLSFSHSPKSQLHRNLNFHSNFLSNNLQEARILCSSSDFTSFYQNVLPISFSSESFIFIVTWLQLYVKVYSHAYKSHSS